MSVLPAGTQKKWHGLISYSEGLLIQEKSYSLVKDSKHAPGMVLGFEFQPTITLGRRSNNEKDLVTGKEELHKQGISVVSADRGGHATLHSPGQLVIYPVLRLKDYDLTVKSFVELLQQTTENFLSSLGVKSFQKDSEPGIFTDKGKIAFFGLRIRNGISQHGLSINISNDLSLFSQIRSCGVDGERFDRVSDSADFSGTGLNERSIPQLFDQWCDGFGQTKP